MQIQWWFDDIADVLMRVVVPVYVVCMCRSIGLYEKQAVPGYLPYIVGISNDYF